MRKWIFVKATGTLGHEGGATFRAWSCEARNVVIAGASGIPPGTYTLGAPEWIAPEDKLNDTSELSTRALGPCFIPIHGVPGQPDDGIHGGGSALEHPLAARQGWAPTEDCIRVQNADLYHLALNASAGDALDVV